MEALAVDHPVLDAGDARRLAADRLLAAAGRAYQLAFRVASRPEAAEDAVQQGFLSALSTLPPGLSAEEERLWFYGVVTNTARKQMRSEVRRRRREMIAVQAGSAAAPGAAPDGELVADLRKALEELDVDHRLPVALCCEQGLTKRQAAAVLNLPESTLADRLRYGLEQLRKALARSGYAAASAAMVGALGHTAPPVPVTLAAALQKLASGEAITKGTTAATASAAAKGGLAMKVIVGVILAGALAGTIGLMGPIGPMGSPPPAVPVSGPPKQEHVAFSAPNGLLDGPRLEALSLGSMLVSADADGNLWVVNLCALGAVRVLRADTGMVETVSGDSKWNTDLALAEGPAAFLPELTTHLRAMARGFSWISAVGSPLKGEEQGCIYAGCQSPPYKIFMNKEKGGRWWFKRLGNTGKARLPVEVGKTVRVDDVNLSGAAIRGDTIQNGGDFYGFDAAKGEITCLLSTNDYADKIKAAKTGKLLGPAQYIFRGGDGNFYLSYVQWVPECCIFRVSPDRTKIEEIMRSTTGDNVDRSGLEAGYWGGPSIMGVTADVVLINAIDGCRVRRWKEGRTSTLDRNGEWREMDANTARQQAWMFKGWTPDFKGNAVWTPHPGEESKGDTRLYRIAPIDFIKPTAGAPAKGGQ